MVMNLINHIQKQRFVRRWLHAMKTDDLKLPENEDILELMFQQMERDYASLKDKCDQNRPNPP